MSSARFLVVSATILGTVAFVQSASLPARGLTTRPDQAAMAVGVIDEGRERPVEPPAHMDTPDRTARLDRSTVPPSTRRAFFGDLHLHTALSFDAWTFGTKLLPDQAYKFGRGETVMVPARQVAAEQGLAVDGMVRARRAWPLDFMAVTDHAEFMGVLHQLDDPNSAAAKSAAGQRILDDPRNARTERRELRENGGGPLADPAFNLAGAMRSAWDLQVRAANENYVPGKFTTFIGYEWTSAPNGRNLHRTVTFSGSQAPLPFSAEQSKRPEDLWTYLEAVRAQGADVIAIPHNDNASGGLMFDWTDSDAKPIDEAYARRRAFNEPLTETMQSKGQSETLPSLSPSDEFANFEVWDHFLGAQIKSEPNGSYYRQALGRGMILQRRTGVNPFKLGVMAVSDFHNGLSVSGEDGFASDTYGIDPETMLPRGVAAKKALNIIPPPPLTHLPGRKDAPPVLPNNPLEYGSAGLTGVWAEENTRESIFAAFRRKETFATSGTRVRVRIFGSWSFRPNMTGRHDWVSRAYAEGVPMGGDLPIAPKGKKPRFVVEAMKDPDGANLDRVQIIKVWVEGGEYMERVFDVALSDARHVDPRTGRARPVGNTVDLRTGRYTNTIGAPVLRGEWIDTAFAPTTPAAYYARVLEIPTPRWSSLLAIANNLPLSNSVATTIQERATSSPIWYTPATP